MSRWVDSKNLDFELKQVNEEGTFEGLASTWDIDLGNDQIVPGAFQKTIQSGKSIPILWAHDTKLPIGVIQELKETAQGLYVKGKLALDIPEAKRAWNLLRLNKSVLAMSIGYRTDKEKYEGNIRKLLSLSLMEISIVVFPMNPNAIFADVKSISFDNSITQSAIADFWCYYEQEKNKLTTKLDNKLKKQRRAKMNPIDRLELTLRDLESELRKKEVDAIFNRIEKLFNKLK